MKFLLRLRGGWIHAGGTLREAGHQALLFVKEEMDTPHWEWSAPGHATGSWQNRQDERTFFGTGCLVGGALPGEFLLY